MLYHSFNGKIFPNIQIEPLLVHFETISPCLTIICLGGAADPHLSTTSFQGVLGN